MISLLFLVYGDRKIWAAVQMRKGPNVVGPFGLLQSVADALKYVLKEVVVPAGADRAGNDAAVGIYQAGRAIERRGQGGDDRNGRIRFGCGRDELALGLE